MLESKPSDLFLSCVSDLRCEADGTGALPQGKKALSIPVAVVQSLSCVQLFATPWTVACQTSLSFTISLNLLKLMSLESVMPTISCSVFPFSSCPQSFPASGSFPISRLFTSGGQSTEASASVSVLPMNIFFRIDWFDLLAV